MARSEISDATIHEQTFYQKKKEGIDPFPDVRDAFHFHAIRCQLLAHLLVPIQPSRRHLAHESSGSKR